MRDGENRRKWEWGGLNPPISGPVLVGSRVSGSPSRLLSCRKADSSVERNTCKWRGVRFGGTHTKKRRSAACRWRERRFQNNNLVFRAIAEPLRGGPEGRRCKASSSRAPVAADARLSGRGGGDPKGVSAGGGTSTSARSMRNAVTCVNTLVVVLLAVHLVVLLAVEGALVRTTMQSGIRPSVPSNQKRDSGHSLFRLGSDPEVLFFQGFVSTEPSASPSLWRQTGRKRNWFRFLRRAKARPACVLSISVGSFCWFKPA